TTAIFAASPLAAQTRFPHTPVPVIISAEPDRRWNVHEFIPEPSPAQKAVIAVLNRYQIRDLGTLGKLTLTGTVVPRKGLLTPDIANMTTPTKIVAATRRQGQTFVPLAGDAKLLPAKTPPPPIVTGGM